MGGELLVGPNGPVSGVRIRLVLADRHPIFLHGLDQFLTAAGEFEVAACCASGRYALQAVQTCRPDILVTALRLPDFCGLELLRQIRQSRPDTRTVILTADLRQPELLEAIRLEVDGVILKEMAPRLLVQCLRKVHAGGQWLENRAMQAALETVLRREAGRRKAEKELTPREIVLVCMVAEGLRNKDIATQLHITEGTVKTHLRNIYRKLHRDTRVALRRYAEERALI